MCIDVTGGTVKVGDLVISAADILKHAEQQAEIKRLQREKQARIYYQNIVYHVCSVLDAIEGRHISDGTGIVCGTLETPATGVQEAMGRVRVEIERLQQCEGDCVDERPWTRTEDHG